MLLINVFAVSIFLYSDHIDSKFKSTLHIIQCIAVIHK